MDRRTLLLLPWALLPLAARARDARELLVASDRIRNPGRAFRVKIALSEFDGGKQVDSTVLMSYSRTMEDSGQFASLVSFVLPERDAGKLMLKSGNELWFYDPNTKASVRISPQQRLIGQAANGDVVTANFAKDYVPTLLAEEEIQDGERRTRRCHKLELLPSNEGATYARIELWIDADDLRPIRGRFYSDSGRLLKTAFYRRYERHLGAERPTENVIIDGVNPRSVTLIRFSEYSTPRIPASWFNRDFLPRFQPE